MQVCAQRLFVGLFFHLIVRRSNFTLLYRSNCISHNPLREKKRTIDKNVNFFLYLNIHRQSKNIKSTIVR